MGKLRMLGSRVGTLAPRKAGTLGPKSATYSPWYRTYEWQQVRARQLAKHPLCQYCERQGRIEEATVCDHVTPHRGDRTLFLRGPFQSLCRTCHNSTKKREEIAAHGL